MTPGCVSPTGPNLLIAGGSRAAARRAARHGLGFISQSATPGLKEFYEGECRANGHEPGVVQFPAPNTPTAVFVADDVDGAWDELGPYLLHDARTAASYRNGDDTVASISRAHTVPELQQPGGAYQILTREEAAGYVRGGRPLPLLPLCGGLPPDVAWPYPSGLPWRPDPTEQDSEEYSVPRPLRTVVWSTGGVGSIAIDAIGRRPDLELVGVWVHSASKVGPDAGELAGRAPLGVPPPAMPTH